MTDDGTQGAPSDDRVRRTVEHVRAALDGDGSGHDWWHVDRVRRMADRLAREEGADRMVVAFAALLHDLGDWKLHDGDVTVAPRMAREWLESLGVEEDTIAHVCEIVGTLSFKGAAEPTPMRTVEGKVVQDADRLDAIGALGIGRAFAYGGSRSRAMHEPDASPKEHATFEEYRKGDGTTVHHFHEKLFLLRDRMNTETARRIAEGRHRFMEEYLARFLDEWEGSE